MQHNKDGEQKLFSLFGLFSLIYILGSSLLFAGSFEDFKRVQSESFHKYKDKRDNEFNKYLKEQWKEYTAYITKPLFQEQKPEVITPLEEKKALNVGPIVKITLPSQKEQIEKKAPVVDEKKAIKLDFFGRELGFSPQQEIQKAKFYPRAQAGISNFFSILASSDYQITLAEIQRYKKELDLNDWGVYLLVKQFAVLQYKDKDEAKIYMWFLFNKLQYDVKIALNESKHIYLLHYTKNQVYSKARFRFNMKNYYILSSYQVEDIKNIYTYAQSYPNATKALDFTLDRLPQLAKKIKSKHISFRENNKVYQYTYHYNQEIIDFMKTYPQVNYSVYFNAPMEVILYNDLVRDLKKDLDGKKMSSALNFVLHFVQKAFQYRRDQQQFGYEKVMFAEETLVYKASDCEDRAVLFAYLVKHIFGISVVGVKYSDHISTALYIPMRGDTVIYNQRRYVMADPTYINANIGQEIPKYRDIEPEYFIQIEMKSKRV